MTIKADTVTEKVVSTLTGRVVSTKMQKTIVVLISRKVKHPFYHKYITRHTKVFAHDENEECAVGDIVVLVPCRPLSKKKSWKLNKILSVAKQKVS